VVDDLEATITNPSFKHKDFWQVFERAGQETGKITPEEARAALEAYDA
jgi:ATP-dependent DNA helicase 2 subunit 2